MTYREFVKTAAELLKNAGIEDADTEALEFLLTCRDWTRTAFLLHREDEIPEHEFSDLSEKLKLRKARVPLQHITGKAWFYGRCFSVTPEVLIPRLDTEILVSEVLSKVPEPQASVLDLCTGSGCIAVTLKLEGGYSAVSASDISPEALRVAEQNARDMGAEIRFYESDLLDDVFGTFDVIVSNPPYIAETEISALAPEVKDHDPLLALYGGRDGLDFYRRIAKESRAYLTRHGKVFLEIGASQGAAVKLILSDAGFREICITKDLAGLDRVISGSL